MVAENKFQQKIVQKLKTVFPFCIILKNDPNYIQGIPDLLILNGTRWACLEVKTEKDSPRQPNQDYFLKLFNDMSFARLIYPENLEEVFDELQSALTT